MPLYKPNTRFSDCWSSVGEVTFFHIDGVCYWKNKAHPVYPGTPGQRANEEVHKRALEAWKNLPADVQEAWNERAKVVPSHRPPYDGTSGITGHNLFVSAYHGFAQLGDEHVPVPAVWRPFPIFVMEPVDAVADGEDLRIRMRVLLSECSDPTRYRLLTKLHLAAPGRGRDSGQLRNFLAEGNCAGEDSIVTVTIPDYRSIWSIDLQEYQVHCRYLLIDTQSGYRCIHHSKSFLLQIP